MAEIFDTLLLLALPASGKSETRQFLTERDPAGFHMGPTVQLDDYPYVHLQIRVDEELSKMGLPQIYHQPPEGYGNGPFIDSRDIAALIELLNDDYAELLTGAGERPERAAARLFERFDAASSKVGTGAKIAALPAEVRAELEKRLEAEARALFDEKAENCPASLDGKTVVIEFARGGPEGASMPLTDGFGYEGSLPHLSPEILERACILYIWVTPEESRRKNRARARPGEQASILFHGTPEIVMRNEYGSCDMAYLLEQSDVPGTIRIERDGRAFHIPTERFDNRTDLTSFLREPPEAWAEEDVEKIYAGIRPPAAALWATHQRIHVSR